MKIETTATNSSFEYWSHKNKLFFMGSSIVTLECGVTEKIANISVEYKLNNKLLNYVQSSIEKLVKSRGYNLTNCSLCLNKRYIHYLPTDGNNYVIGFQDYQIEPNEVEKIFLNMYNKIEEDEVK